MANDTKETMTMKPIRTGLMSAVIAGSLLAGGALGATVFSAGTSGAATSSSQTTTSTAQSAPSAPPGAPGALPGGKFKPNENKAHEAAESAQREAEENEGKFPTTSP